MNGRFVFRILLAIILIAVLAGVGVFIYNAGVAQGLAAGSGPSAPEGQAVPYPFYGWPHFRPWGFGFFPFGFIFPLFFGLLIIWLISGLFFRGWRGHGRGHYWGEYNRGPRDVPPVVEEWHRKMHEGQSEDPDR